MIHMQNRKHGELILDMGISYHPLSREKGPLVGLWKLQQTGHSYQLMGTLAGTTHHTCTLAGYGGRQAKMDKSRRLKTELLYRSTYNLVFELVRVGNHGEYLCSDDDAIRAGSKYNDACQAWKSLFFQAMDKSFGVREEVRGSAAAILDLLPQAPAKVRNCYARSHLSAFYFHSQAKLYLKSDPILWVPSGIYFRWLVRRLAELQNIQLKLVWAKPPNYGLMSIIVTHLMRCVMVTPQVKHKFLSTALRDLNFKGVMVHFGMFFLHDLNIRSCVLKEVSGEDCADIISLHGHALRKEINRPSKAKRPLQLVGLDAHEEFPWGEEPSWPRIQQLLRTECCDFLRPWIMDPEQQAEDFVQRLFITFTRDVWLSMSSHVVDERLLPHPISLEEAMHTWTAESVERVVSKDRCHFLPSAHGLDGKLPKNLQRMSFADRRTIFFPDLNVNIPDRTIWKPYTNKNAYLGLYHSRLVSWSEDQIVGLNSQLDGIFSNLQCLPLSRPCNVNGSVIWSTSAGKVQFVTNSSFYRIARVGNQVSAHDLLKRAQASVTQLQTRISQAHGGPKVTMAPTRFKEKSLKARNKRQPPTRRK
jgi:hypothetical protein